jgi:hypothetical protein
MRVVRELTKRGISVVFPIRRSVHYICDMPDILVHIGNEKYLGVRFESDIHLLTEKGKRIRKHRLAVPLSDETAAINEVLKQVKLNRENT